MSSQKGGAYPLLLVTGFSIISLVLFVNLTSTPETPRLSQDASDVVLGTNSEQVIVIGIFGAMSEAINQLSQTIFP